MHNIWSILPPSASFAELTYIFPILSSGWRTLISALVVTGSHFPKCWWLADTKSNTTENGWGCIRTKESHLAVPCAAISGYFTSSSHGNIRYNVCALSGKERCCCMLKTLHPVAERIAYDDFIVLVYFIYRQVCTFKFYMNIVFQNLENLKIDFN